MSWSFRIVLVAVAIVMGLLLFPELVPRSWRALWAWTGGVTALAVAVALAPRGPMQGLLVVLGLLVLQAAWRATPSPATLSHFTGICAGLMTMSLVGAWAQAPRRFQAAAALYVAVACLALVLGAVGASPPDAKLFEPDVVTRALPRRPLLLPGLDSTGWINRNAIGAVALLALPVTLGLAISAWRRRPALLALAAAGAVLALYSIVASQSRSVWLSAGLLLGLWVLRPGAGWRRRATAAGLLGAVSLAGVLALQLSGRVDLPSVARTALVSVGERGRIVSQAIAAVRTDPWLGIGLNEFRHVYQPPPASAWALAPHAHNILLQTVLDIGIIGAGAYLALLLWVLVGAVRLRSLPASDGGGIVTGAALALVGVHVFGIVDAVALGARVGLLQWWACGLIVAAVRASAPDRGPTREFAPQ